MLCMPGFLTLRLSVGLYVCVSVNKISPKILNRSTSFVVDVLPVTQGGNHSILKKNYPGVKVCVCVCVGGGVKIWP